MSQVRISEVVTFIKPTREEAITLAYEIGGGEVHALTIMRGFAPAAGPVGYMVTPWEYKTEAAFKTLENLGYEFCGGELWKPPLGKKEQK
jgi:hypothetical protein